MKKKLIYILILTIALSSFLGLMGETRAADPKITNYELLSPLPCSDGQAGCEGGELASYDPSLDNNLSRYLNTMIKIFIGICAVLAVIMIILGGLEYMTSELISSKEHGKERITHAIFGLILALGAWTILNQINPDLLKADLKSVETITVEVTLEDDVPQTYDPATKKYPNGQTFGDPWTGTPSVLVGVTVSPPGDCATIGQPNCTSIKGLRVGYLSTIKSNCPGCQLVITGGTEFWLHGGKTGSTTHQKGSATVDLRKDGALTNYIKSGTKDTAHRWVKDGISFLEEANHWHVGP